MTRRDYCLVCNEMVGDYDVACSECGESFCYNCIEIYDPLSRLARLIAYANVDCKFSLSEQDINDFIQDINSNELLNFLDKRYPLNKDDSEYELEVRERFNNKKEYILDLYNQKSEKFKNELVEFLDNFLELDEGVEFVCENCHYNIGKSFKIQCTNCSNGAFVNTSVEFHCIKCCNPMSTDNANKIICNQCENILAINQTAKILCFKCDSFLKINL